MKNDYTLITGVNVALKLPTREGVNMTFFYVDIY